VRAVNSPGIIRVTHSTITGNSQGFLTNSGGVIENFGDNALRGKLGRRNADYYCRVAIASQCNNADLAMAEDLPPIRSLGLRSAAPGLACPILPASKPCWLGSSASGGHTTAAAREPAALGAV